MLKKNKKGFSIVESVAATVLIGIIVTGTLYSFVAAQMWISVAKHHYQAISWARNTIEELSYAGIQDGDVPPANDSVSLDADSGLMGTRSVVYNFDPTGNPDDVTVRVTVNINWTESMWIDKNLSETVVVFLNTI